MKNISLMLSFLVLSFSSLVLSTVIDNTTQKAIMGLLSKIFMIVAIVMCSNELLWKKEKE